MIEFRHVSKTYGQQKAVDDLNLQLGGGQLFGINWHVRFGEVYHAEDDQPAG
ncbi:ABC transporter ATP-binding protein [Citrobacter freundii]|nr:ABC transporter ATP-binding protein [Citrobacter freundii]